MSFEKEFPSLKCVKCRTFTAECLMKTCLDKQKLKDAIKIVCEKDNDGSIFYAMELLEKELKNNGT